MISERCILTAMTNTFQTEQKEAMTILNKAIVCRLYDEVINAADTTVIDQIFDADVVVHDPLSGTAVGIDVLRNLLAQFDVAFPGHEVSVESMLADGDKVAVLHTHYATHSGPFMGLPATGKVLVVNGLELFRLRNGKIVEMWRKDDDVSLLAQLGVISLSADV